MSGPYGPQNTRELLDKLVEEKGFIRADEIGEWVEYFDDYINDQKIAHADRVIGEDEESYNPESRAAKHGLGQYEIGRNSLRAEQRERNKS